MKVYVLLYFSFHWEKKNLEMLSSTEGAALQMIIVFY